MSRGYWAGGQTPCPIGVGNDRYHWPSAVVLVTVAAAPADRRLPRHLMPAFSDPQPIPAPSSIATSVPSQPWCRYRPTRCGPLLNIERSLRPCRAAPRRHAKRPAAAAGAWAAAVRPAGLGTAPGFARPELVSEINVAQPALSQGSATVVAAGYLLDDAHVSADQFEAGEEHLTWIHRAHMWHDASTLLEDPFLPLGLAPLGEAPSRLRWPARLRRSHRVHDASWIQAEPGVDAPRNGSADAAATGDEPSAASPRLTPADRGNTVTPTG
jgi:hypothetical protein